MPSLWWVTLNCAISSTPANDICPVIHLGALGNAVHRRATSRECYIGKSLDRASSLLSEASLQSCWRRIWPTTTVGHYWKEDGFMGEEYSKSSSWSMEHWRLCWHRESHATWPQQQTHMEYRSCQKNRKQHISGWNRWSTDTSSSRLVATIFSTDLVNCGNTIHM